MEKVFEAVIKKVEGKDGAYIEIPFDVEEVFGAKRVKVMAHFDEAEYRGSIVRMGLPCYMIGITKEIRKKIGKEPGDTITVRVKKDEEVREIVLPEDFKKALEKDKEALKFYEGLSYSAKRKYFQWITGAKKEETRQKRMLEAILRLKDHKLV